MQIQCCTDLKNCTKHLISGIKISVLGIRWTMTYKISQTWQLSCTFKEYATMMGLWKKLWTTSPGQWALSSLLINLLQVLPFAWWIKIKQKKRRSYYDVGPFLTLCIYTVSHFTLLFDSQYMLTYCFYILKGLYMD